MPDGGADLRVLRVRQETEKLPAPQREALMLVCVTGLSYRDASLQLGIEVGELVVRLSAARLALAQAVLF